MTTRPIRAAPFRSGAQAETLVFTDYVRSLEPGSKLRDPDEALWAKLRTALTAEMKKRSLWRLSPSCLGICGDPRWSSQALEELLHDCFKSVFIDRLSGLMALLAVQENVEGVIFRNIRSFLFETQKKHDPLGFRVFMVLQSAMRRSISEGRLHVLAGDSGVGNETILGFAPWSDPEVARAAKLEESIREWNNDLLAEMVTARGAALEALTEKLVRRLTRLRIRGIEAFRFKDVIDSLKADVRARWQAVWLHSEGEMVPEDDGDADFVTMARLVRPDAGFEEREAFQKLFDCVAGELERLAKREKTRTYLRRLWIFLRNHAAESPADTPAGKSPAAANKLPSQRQIAGILDIPRYRFPELYQTLGRLVETCQARHAGKRRSGYRNRDQRAVGEEDSTP